MTFQFDENLAQFCTPKQLEAMRAYAEHGSDRKAANAIGIHYATVHKIRKAVLEKAARAGYAPGHWSSGVAPGYQMGKVTVQRGPGGVVERVWERQHPDDVEREAAMRQAAEAMAESLPRLRAISPPKSTKEELCNVYTLTDCHIGMMAWHKEGGKDWDLKIAEGVLTGCFASMVAASPPAEKCIIAQLGDLLHYDSLLPVTPTSGHILDADGRFPKMVEVAIRVLRRVMDMALAKHEKVILMAGSGNHDPAASVWLRCMFKALYENEPRVEVIDTESPYYSYQFGKTALFWHHGHLKKNNNLPLAMAAEFPRIWGDTEYRFCHVGDKHHTEEKEHSGVIVIQHPTLAARDAYASRHGWHSLNRAMSITYHRDYGEVARNYVSPEMLA